MSGKIQAKDIPDEAVLLTCGSVQDENSRLYGHPWATAGIYEIVASLPEYPEKVVVAKLRSMVKRCVLWCECDCGCNGKFQVPDHPRSDRVIADMGIRRGR